VVLSLVLVSFVFFYVKANWFGQSDMNVTDSAVAIESNQRKENKNFVPSPLFGEPLVEKVIIPKKMLNIKLEGTILGERPVAIIASAEKIKAYAVNEMIAEGVSLLEVYVDHIVISDNGTHKKLAMKSGTLEVLCSDCDQSQLAEQTVDIATLEETASKKRKTIPNPMSLANLFTSKAVRENGKVIGYQIEPKDNLVLFEYLQLNAGDVITKVNDMPLSDLSKLSDLQTELQRGTLVNIHLIRDGQEKLVSVTLP
jgi:general secretion pathway protein C